MHIKNNFMLSSRDSIIIYNFIKRNYKFILNGDESSFKDLEQQLDKDLYKKIKELYMYYKKQVNLNLLFIFSIILWSNFFIF